MTHRLLPLPFLPFFQLTQQILMKAHNCALVFFDEKQRKLCITFITFLFNEMTDYMDSVVHSANNKFGVVNHHHSDFRLECVLENIFDT